MTFITLAVFTFIFTAATLLPLSRYQKWWVRILDFPRLQIAAGIAGLMILQFSLLPLSQTASWLLIGINICCFLYQAWWIFPFSPLFPAEVKLSHPGGSESLKIITGNVLADNKKYNRFLNIIRKNQPHIIVTLESDMRWQIHLDKLEHQYPYTVKCPKNNLYGMHVYSRLPLENADVKYLVEPDIPSIHAEAVLPSQQRIQLYFLHPKPPFPTEAEESTERDAEIIVVAKMAAQSNLPVIVTGDLNDVAWSATTRLFRKISGLLDPRIGRGMFNTYHADYWFIRWPLDYFFHSSHFTLEKLIRLPPFGSDHFAILIELIYQPEKKPEQKALQADADDRHQADEKLEAVDSK